MSFIRYLAVLPIFLILCTHTVMADEVMLDDGSQLKGSIRQIAYDELIMQTSFAGEDFRVVTNFTAEMPLGQSDFWKLRAGMREPV